MYSGVRHAPDMRRTPAGGPRTLRADLADGLRSRSQGAVGFGPDRDLSRLGADERAMRSGAVSLTKLTHSGHRDSYDLKEWSRYGSSVSGAGGDL